MEAAKVRVVITLPKGSTKCQRLCRTLEEPHLTFQSLFNQVELVATRFLQRQRRGFGHSAVCRREIGGEGVEGGDGFEHKKLHLCLAITISNFSKRGDFI